MDSLTPSVMLVLLLAWPAFAVVMAAVATALSPRPGRADSGGRDYWIVIPALNEAKVIARTVQAALALDSTRAPVHVLVVDDGSDDATAEVLRGIDDPRLHVIRRDYPQARQGKGAALNAGYRAVRDWALEHERVETTILAVIDGDGQCPPDVIRDVVDDYFADPGVGGLQCRVRIRNRQRLLGLLQDLEFSCVANASQSFRDLVDSVGLGGNGQFIRLRELMRFGDEPWSDCLVEDLELGLRLHLAGVRIRYSSAAVVDQQAIVHIRRLLRQRARWAQGNLQCARHLRSLGRSRRVGSLGLVDYLAYLIPPWLAAPMSVAVAGAVSLVLAGLTTGNSLGGLIATGHAVPGAVGIWVSMIFLPGLIWAVWHRWKLGDEPLWRCLLAGLVYPLFLMLAVLATWRGLARHLSGRDNWVKTERHDEIRTREATPDPINAGLSSSTLPK
ncbi:MAG TPA: glycosyltransferase [Micromonosporaceae bacterium]